MLLHNRFEVEYRYICCLVVTYATWSHVCSRFPDCAVFFKLNEGHFYVSYRYGFPEMMQALFKEGGVYSMPDEELKAVEKSCHKRSADLFKVGGLFYFSYMLSGLATVARI